MVDSLDMHAVVGDGEGFREATATLLRDFRSGVLTFDRDVVVSVFEASIRVLGGLVRERMRRIGCGRRRKGWLLVVLLQCEWQKSTKGFTAHRFGVGMDRQAGLRDK